MWRRSSSPPTRSPSAAGASRRWSSRKPNRCARPGSSLRRSAASSKPANRPDFRQSVGLSSRTNTGCSMTPGREPTLASPLEADVERPAWLDAFTVYLKPRVLIGALCVATASATQDIAIDAFRIETLEDRDQAAGMASYVAAYRIGMLASTAGALFLVSAFEGLGTGRQAAWTWGYVVMAALV